jgi:hypothetical protein
MRYNRLFGQQLVNFLTDNIQLWLRFSVPGCDALAAIERIIVISFTEAERDCNSRLSVILNRAYKVIRLSRSKECILYHNLDCETGNIQRRLDHPP